MVTNDNPIPQADYAYAVADEPTTGYDKHLADERADAQEADR